MDFRICTAPRRAGLRFWRAILTMLFLAGAAHFCLGAEAGTAFDQANKLYEQGKYKEAVAAYQGLIQQEQTTSALYFNLGNAYFKSGQPGEAIVSYRLAQRLDPRDPDVRANLRFARESLGGSAPARSTLDRWLELITLDELTWAASGLIWVWLVLSILAQFRQEWAKDLRSFRIAIGLAAALIALVLAAVAQKRLRTGEAVVVSKEAVVRYGPFEEAQSFYAVRDGAELAVLNRKDDWLNVRDGSKRTGWLQAKQVHLLPPG